MKNFTNNFKQFTLHLSARWLIMVLMLLVGTSSAWAWGWVVRCVDLQSSESPTYYLGDEATFYWCFNADGSNASFKRACISTSSSSAGTWMDNLEWVKDGCDGNDNKTWKASFLLSSTGTKYYGLWLGWGNSVGDNGRYYNGSSSWGEGSTTFSSSKFTVNELPNPTDQTNSLSGTTATLSWENNSTYTTVLVVRYAKGATETKPKGGTSYSANNTIGNGTVVYKGTAGSCTNTITAGNSYDYYFYTVNNNYYSSGVKTTLEGCSTPELSDFTYTLPDDDNTKTGNEVMWDGNTHAATVTWAGGNSTEGITIYYTKTGGSKTQTAPSDAGTYTVTIETTAQGDFCATNNSPITLGTFTITCPSIAAPALTTPDPICAGTQVTLSNYNGVNTNTVKWYSNSGCTNDATTVIPEDNSIYYAKAYDEASGCYSSEYSTLTFTVNPLPTINIGEDVTAVKFEDVVLTATGNNIADVTWIADKGTITKDATDLKKAVLTYDQTGDVTVTAKAISAEGCESTEVSKEVTFSAEDCNSTTRNDLIITCNPNGYYGDVYLHIWPNGEGSLTAWPGYKGEWKDNVWRWEISASLLSTSKQYDIIFNNNEGAQTQDLDHNLIPGNQYNYTLNHTNWGDGNNRPTMGKVDPIPLTQDPPITAPAVKMVDVNSDDGEGNLIMSAQIVKTGCDNSISYQFKYRLQGADNWSVVQVGSNQSKKAGDTFNKEITGLEEGGIYEVCATITNDADTYTCDIMTINVNVTKTAITNVTLAHANSDGSLMSETPTYCVGDVVYFKLTHDGSPFSEYDWTTYPGSGLAGYCSNGSGLYHFTLSGAGTIGISLRNDANLDGETKTWAASNNLEFSTYPDPVAPTISLDKSTLCDNDEDGATITVSGAVVYQSYALYKEATDDGDDTPVGEPIQCTPEEQSISFNLTGSEVAGKYYVLAIEPNCNRTAGTSSVTLSVISTEGLSISIEPDAATVTPWETAKLTVSATEGYTYTLTGLENMEYTANGNVYNVKIPKPETTGTDDDGNITFSDVEYTVTATLNTGGEVSCVSPATCTLTLTPYIEPCTQE